MNTPPAHATLRILGRVSSINVRKVLWTCDELGLPFAREDWGLGYQPTRSPEFLALNPNALVPVLVDDGFVLWESNTICRYLAARERRTDLLPADPRERARVEQWMDWQAADLNNASRYAFLGLVRHSPEHADAAAIAASVQAWNHQMLLLDAQLARTGAFVVGNTFTLADINLGLCLHRWQMAPIERPALPALAAYRERLSQRAGFLRHAAKETP